ncbi:MAG: cell division protein ZapA [Clostridia bacterium]|nr:cell division protein ZapA [Clostridia bacterium]
MADRNFYGLPGTESYKSNMLNRQKAERFYENLNMNKQAFNAHEMKTEKQKVEVLLDGVIYTIVSDEEESYMQKVAFYLNQKLSETRKMESTRNMDLRAVALLTSLNIADEYCKLLDDSNQKAIDIKKLESEVDIYKKEYEHSNKENELLKAEIETLKMQILREKNAQKVVASE